MSKLKDAIYGLAVGDALGVPYEFKKRNDFLCIGMKGHGSWNQPAGTWSDDTSMTIATCDSIREKGAIDYDDIMKKFREWLFEAKYTAHNEVFDVGNATLSAITKSLKTENPIECGGRTLYDNGNGSLMRILPLAFTNASDEEIMNLSALTHAHEISKNLCVKYIKIARELIAGKSIEETLKPVESFMKNPRKDIKSTGYVVDSFYAALWCLRHTHSYKSCILRAVNLGGDTDTIAAIAGGLAGIVYGYKKIPKNWIKKLQNKKLIDSCLWEA